MAVFTVSLQQASGVGDVSLGDGTTLATLAVSAGRGPKGDGFTGGTYDAGTGKVTFTSNDGIGFETGDLRGDLTEPGPIGSVTPNTGAFTSLSTTGDAVVGGNLTVEGTTTTVDSTTVAVGDKNIELAKDATTPAEADGGGITLTGAAATITYSSANDYWALNKGLNVSGNVSLSGTVDGRDVAADGTKLDGIESGATADQTAGEIKTAYESNADTNAFTDSEKSKLSGIETGAEVNTVDSVNTQTGVVVLDADDIDDSATTNKFTTAADISKLSGIEAGADVTDTANVTAAGALMDSELTSEASVKALDQGVATTDSPDFAGLTVDTNTLYVDSANDRLGIGTSSPSENLTVAGSDPRTNLYDSNSVATGLTALHEFDGTDTRAGYMGFVSGDMRLQVDTAENMLFVTNSSEAMRIDSSGNVGIGTSSPDEALHVMSGAFNSNVARLTGGASTRGLLVSTYTANGFSDTGVDLAALRALSITINNSEAMRIDSSGNVGIGTSSPSATLDVNGSLSKNSGSFKIDHPVKPDTHHLVHSFIEGPQADNLYRGKVALSGGKAVVNLDEAGRMAEGTFVSLNGNVQCFTTNEDGWTQVRGKVECNILTIEAQDPACTDEVSWLVIGERHDQHMMDAEWTDDQGRVITEPEKENTQ